MQGREGTQRVSQATTIYVMCLNTDGMANTIKESGFDGVALQITKPARSAGFVEETAEGKATRLPEVRVHAFDHLLVVVDREAVQNDAAAELVVTAIKYTQTVYRALDATVQLAGHGYQVQLPPARDAGFRVDDKAACHPSEGIICISKDDGTKAGRDAAKTAREIVRVRDNQVYSQ